MTATHNRLDDVTVVVPHWNTPDYTIRCVDALVADGVSRSRIVIVDNGSTDGSYDLLQGRLQECMLVRSADNIGYAGAINLGARSLPGSAYVLMNNDAFAHKKGSVERLLASLDDAAVGLSVPRCLNLDETLQPSVVPLNSPLAALVRASGLSRFVPNAWAPRVSTHWNHEQSREIEAANGAVMLVRGETWTQLGGMDEQIYMYGEDLDVCWRTRKLGWKIWFTAESEFVHVGNGSGRKQWSDAKRSEMIGASESAVIRRHLPRASAAATIGLISAGIAARWLAFSLFRQTQAAASYRGSLRGYLRRRPVERQR